MGTKLLLMCAMIFAVGCGPPVEYTVPKFSRGVIVSSEQDKDIGMVVDRETKASGGNYKWRYEVFFMTGRVKLWRWESSLTKAKLSLPRIKTNIDTEISYAN